MLFTFNIDLTDEPIILFYDILIFHDYDYDYVIRLNLKIHSEIKVLQQNDINFFKKK